MRRVVLAGRIILFVLTGTTALAQNNHMPFRFEENKGQFASDVRYVGWATGYSAELTRSDVVFRSRSTSVRMSFAGALGGSIERLDPMAAESETYDMRAARFYSHIRNFQRVRYSSLYPGIDALFRSTAGALEFDFVLTPEADYKSIVLDFSGQKGLDISNDGTVVLKTADGEMRLPLPSVYQETRAGRKEITARYRRVTAHRIGFDIGPYASGESLVIDPQLIFASYAGASGRETPVQLVMGPEGQANVLFNIYRTNDFTVNHATVVRFSAGGAPLAFYELNEVPYNYLSNDYGYALAVSNQNDVALIASVQPFGPNPPYTPSPNSLPHVDGTPDVLLIKFGSSHWASYLGGSDNDVGKAVTFDSGGNLYVTGATNSSDFPTRNPYQATLKGIEDAFLTKVDPSGTQILYSTYLGGTSAEYATTIGLDAVGNIYLGGWTDSSDFPTVNPIQGYGGGKCHEPCEDMFVTKFNPAGTALVYSTYIGAPNAMENVYKIAVTPDGYVLLRGLADDTFPVTSEIFTRSAGCCSAVVLKLEQSGSRIIYSMRFPANDIATDRDGNLFVIGSNFSSGTSYTYPILNSIETDTPRAILVAKFDAVGSMLFSTLIHGANGDLIGVDGDGRVFGSGTAPCYGFEPNPFSTTNGTQAYTCNITSATDPVVFVLNPASGPDTSPRYSRIEENYPQVELSPNWYVNAPPQTSHSAGRAVLAMDAGERFTINFTGTEIKWYGCKDEWSGIARVTLDGSAVGEIDSYMTPGACHVLIWSKSGLGEGTHTLVVEVLGRKNSASAGQWVWLDVLEITSNGDASFDAPSGGGGGGGGTTTWTRVEETDPQVQYAGSWYSNSSQGNSGGSANLALSDSTATLNFSGTGARWIGLRDAWSGIANVYVDGSLQSTVDSYAGSSQYQSVLYAFTGLSAGNHALKIEATGQKNPASAQAWIWVDAFEVASTSGGGGGGTPDFSVTAAPVSATVIAGGSTAYTVTVTAANGFSGNVSLGASGFGAEASGSFSVSTIAGSGTATFTVVTNSTAQTGQFTLTITGSSGTRSRSTTVSLTVNPGTPASWTRVEQNNASMQYAGAWYDNTSEGNSAGSASLALSDASATFSFSGTGVRWIGLRDAWAGTANVYVDGQFKGVVDTYSSESQYQSVLFAITGLGAGNHTLKIEATGQHSPTSGAAWIWIDAVETSSH